MRGHVARGGTRRAEGEGGGSNYYMWFLGLRVYMMSERVSVRVPVCVLHA